MAPHTLADCVHVQQYADTLYWMRHAVSDDAGDHWPAFQAFDDFCFRQMATIAPRSKDEALLVFDFMVAEELMDRNETNAILRNLVAGGWA